MNLGLPEILFKYVLNQTHTFIINIYAYRMKESVTSCLKNIDRDEFY